MNTYLNKKDNKKSSSDGRFFVMCLSQRVLNSNTIAYVSAAAD
jgi:hypothetical protein